MHPLWQVDSGSVLEPHANSLLSVLISHEHSGLDGFDVMVTVQGSEFSI